MRESRKPLGSVDTASLFGAHRDRLRRPCGLAVSGGSDSTALMVLFAEWLRGEGGEIGAHMVLTVDHRLRPESTAEAQAVAARATFLGFRHTILAWEGPKPSTGLQAAARHARYQLMRDHLRAHGCNTLVTAHTLDDQAETFLMRLARGSGLDGLSAMSPVVSTGEAGDPRPLVIVRPFLDVPKARLRATLAERGIGWVEDPSNQSTAFERVRWRAAREQLHALGLTDEMIASSARRLRRARAAVSDLADHYFHPAAGVVHAYPFGVLRIDRGRMPAASEVFLRVLGRCIALAGGTGEWVSLAKLEVIAAALQRGETGTWTLARAKITASANAIEVEREPGRQPLPRMTLAAGSEALWDGRFRVGVAKEFGGELQVRALETQGLAELRRRAAGARPSRRLRLAPSFWSGDELRAVPCAGFWQDEPLRKVVYAEFTGLHYNPEAEQPAF
ncbi:MAG TPA: tRNA lysidine(34) synthetase TilS [Hyphomicrobiaceae bacterium]|nr:tRNA lysidine(34) synthetase TilS [Hyphomicrobiaceae bacterium]